MKSLRLAILAALLALLPALAQTAPKPQAKAPPKTGWDFQLADDVSLHLGGDLRTRYETFNRAILNPDGGMKGPAVQYLRFRTRLWTDLTLGEDVSIRLRLVNRSQYFTSNTSNPNNIHRGGATWQFPDEVILDLAEIEFRRLAGIEGLSLNVGRLNFGFGNGLIFSEGTPHDQARTSYYDGARLRYKDDVDDLSILVLYNTWKDRATVLNDRNRRLRAGDIFTAGVYWTRKQSAAFNFDLYYFFDDIDDDKPNQAERRYPADMNRSLHTAGARIFGSPESLDFLEYSVEGALQLGNNADNRPHQANMLDARLLFHLPDAVPCNSSIGLAYTHFSGDRTSTRKGEGWIPVWSACPIWAENLIPLAWNSFWSNLNMYQLDLNCKPTEALSFKLRTAACYAAHASGAAAIGSGPCTGGGNFYGLLTSLFADYKFNDHLSFSAEFSHMSMGDYYRDGHDPNWLQLQILWTF